MAGYGPTPIRRGTVDPSARREPGSAHPYMRGVAFERACALWLERRGWHAKRSYGSKGTYDLLAIRHGAALMIQCKLTGDIGSGDWNALYELATPYGAWPVVAFRSGSRQISFMRLDGLREARKHGRPWQEFDPATLQEALTLAA